MYIQNVHVSSHDVGQGYDGLGKRKAEVDELGAANAATRYPLSAYMLLSTGQTYYVLSLAYYTAQDEKPTLLFHGQTRLPVLPYFGGQGPVDPDNSGLLSTEAVKEEQVENAMATLAVCLETFLPITVPHGWRV